MYQLQENDTSRFKLWIADVNTGKARPLFESPDISLNGIFEKYVATCLFNILHIYAFLLHSHYNMILHKYSPSAVILG